MTQQLPAKFVRQTRWAFIQDGIEVGPYDANEIVELLREREISPDTTLVELNTRRTCPLTEVGPFASIVMTIVQADRKNRSDREFVAAGREISEGGRRTTVLATILVLLVLGIGGAALFIFNPFAPPEEKDGPYQGVAGADESKEQPDVVAEAADAGEPAFAITEMDPAELEVDPETELINSVLEERQLNPNAALIGDEEKLEGPAKIDRSKEKKTRRVASVSGGPKSSDKADEAAEEDGIQTMDFSEEEVAMGDGPSGPDDTLAIGRLRKVMKRCVERSLQKFPAGEEVLIDAQANLQPDGRLTGLKINLMPRKAVGEIKMCISAELMRMRVPAFDGDAVHISTAVAVPGR